MGDGLAEGIRRNVWSGSWRNLTSQSDQGSTARSAVVTGGDPVIISDDCYGSRICQFRHYEAETGSGHYHGCQYRYNGDLLDPQPYRHCRETMSFWNRMLKPSSFSPILAIIGVVFLMFSQK